MKSNNSKTIITNYKAHKFVLLLLLLGLVLSCETTEPPPSNQKLTITAEDVSCTEAWLNLKIENISLPTEIVLKQNDTTIITTNINSSGTTLFVENLLPSQAYTFQATSIQHQISSIKIPVTTMDTTSHNFTWETLTFGGGNSSSHFSDVAIINENEIWAVGKIHTEDTDKFDSNGVWVQPYNAVHWDGNKWELKRIKFYIDPDQPSAGKTASPCQSIYLFDDGKLAISSNVQIALFNNDNDYLLIKEGFPWNERFTISSIWGTSSEDFYVVGNGVNIAHYNGSGWKKIESGTEEILDDIYGIDDDIYIAGGSNIDYTGVLLKGNSEGFKIIKEGTAQYVDTIFNPYFVGSLSSVWLSPTGTLYFGGQALYKNKFNLWGFDRTLEGNCLRCNGGGQYYATISKIRGNADNDIIFVGARNTIRHFNGVSWKQLGNEYDPNDTSILWYSVAMNIKDAVAVGSKRGRALIMRLKR